MLSYTRFRSSLYFYALFLTLMSFFCYTHTNTQPLSLSFFLSMCVHCMSSLFTCNVSLTNTRMYLHIHTHTLFTLFNSFHCHCTLLNANTIEREQFILYNLTFKLSLPQIFNRNLLIDCYQIPCFKLVLFSST